MKTLLDEQINVRFKALLEGIEVFTVYDKGWDKLKNGDLRRQMESEGFKVLVTADKNAFPAKPRLFELCYCDNGHAIPRI